MKSSISRPISLSAKARDQRRPQPEAASQAPGDVVLAATFPSREMSRRADASFAGIEAEHDFTQGHEIELTGLGRFDVKNSSHFSQSFRYE